jgi:hypothetical protein
MRKLYHFQAWAFCCSRSQSKLTTFLPKIRLCIIQVIDRIASIQLGSSRQEAVEYQKFIIPKEGHKIIKMPKSGKTFPDLSGGSAWRSATVQVPVAAGFDSLVDTDSKLKQIDIDDEVKLEPVLQRCPPKNLGREKMSCGLSRRLSGSCLTRKGNFLLRHRVRLR